MHPPTHLSVKLPPDVAELLHRTAYETGRTKQDLVTDALRKTYGEIPVLQQT
jgi:hypothetical protein